MNNLHEKTKLVLSIAQSGNGKKWTKELKRNNLLCNFHFSGKGTVASDMLAIFGLDSSEKDIILSFGNEFAVDSFCEKLCESLRQTNIANGIMMIFAPSAVSSLVSALVNNHAKDMSRDQKGESVMKNDYEYSLIIAAVNQGFSEDVMQTARKAGATGGTVIRARLSDADNAEQFYGITMQPEKEILAIMTSSKHRNNIMEAINAEFGMRSEAQAFICSLPIEKVFKI